MLLLASRPTIERPGQDVTEGLIAHWKLDETSGTAVSDATGNFPGSIVGSATWVPGKIGGALEFAGNGYVDFYNPVISDVTDFTISYWAKVPVDGAIAVSRGEDGMGNGWSLLTLVNPQGTGFGIITYQYWDFGSTPTPGADIWTHVTFVFAQAGGYGTYVDGVLGATGPIGAHSLRSSTRGMVLGRFNGGLYTGTLDDVRVYNRVLLAQEIADLYAYWNWG